MMMMKNGQASGFFVVLLLGILLLGGVILLFGAVLTGGYPGTGPAKIPLLTPATPVATIAQTQALVTNTTLQAVPEGTPAPIPVTPESAAVPALQPSLQTVPERTPRAIPATTAPAATPDVSPSPQTVSTTVFVPQTTVPAPGPAATAYRDEESASLSYRAEETAGTGTLVTRVTGCSADNLVVFIARSGTTGSPVDDEDLLAMMAAGGDTTDLLPVKVLPDGSSEPVKLQSGTYTAYLPAKDGDSIEERQIFRIGTDLTTWISFEGASYLNPGASCPSCSTCSRRR